MIRDELVEVQLRIQSIQDKEIRTAQTEFRGLRHSSPRTGAPEGAAGPQLAGIREPV